MPGRSIVTCCFAMLFGSRLLAGDLTPPPGPIAPTDRVTLSAADPAPIVLNSAGSYVLTSNVTRLTGAVIEIKSGGVTLDLNGFSVVGAGVGTVGIQIDTGLTGVTIRNGNVHACERGIMTVAGIPGTLLIENVHARECVNDAFDVANATLRSCTSAGNFGDGFRVRDDCLLVECRAENNGQAGFNCDNGELDRCVAVGNAFSGIYAGDRSIITGCIAYANNNGITVYGGSIIKGCTANSNQFGGLEARDGSLLESSTARGNGLAGTGAGVVLSLGSRATECLSTGNATSGYEVDFQCMVDRCEAHGNTGAGVRVFGQDNRITANHLFGNSPNLDATLGTATGNLIMQNTANGGYSIGGSNDAAPVSLIGVAGPLDNITY
ncbi:MAG: right-handed parallel beta-helix repeat-containing protein [Phycisphaeraceae bacterium]|nr:right-handed parallel beta-helix repeat-containing protein [Phycisphaeraceae bacterium]MCB9848707.1 right-handed parallel beta-helix repeat-containing protein [Phycisphaeraceae bacterium]